MATTRKPTAPVPTPSTKSTPTTTVKQPAAAATVNKVTPTPVRGPKPVKATKK